MFVKVLLLTLFCFTAQAQLTGHSYYQSNLTLINNSSTQELKESLHKAIIKNHRSSNSYVKARQHLFGNLFLQRDTGGYFVKDVYCRKKIRKNHGVGPGAIPNHQVINCEHAWPQSRFNPRFSKSTQKNDLHHLFPTDSKANSTRGNINFANVNAAPISTECQSSKRGTISRNNIFAFEPPNEIKGDVARALFYFSTRYKIKIPSFEEKALKAWHRQDPVDRQEKLRHEKIYKIQKNRNPYIDEPGLVELIEDF